MDHGNPLAVEDVHIVINRSNPIDKLIQEAAEKARGSGSGGAVAAATQTIDQRIEMIRAHWDAEKTAVLCTMRDLFLGLAKSDPDKEIKALLEKKIRAWRKAEQTLQQDYEAEKRELIKLENALQAVTAKITQSYNSMHTGSAEVAAFRVLLNAHRTLRELWGKHVQHVGKEYELDVKLYTGTAQGLHVLCRTVMHDLHQDLAEERHEYETIKADVERLATTQGVGLARQCEELKKAYFTKVYTPLSKTTDVLELPSEMLQSTDPFCVRRCVAAEEALRQLSPVLTQNNPQAEARAKNRQRVVELRQQLAELNHQTRQELMREDAEASKVASVLHAIRFKEKSVQKELQEIMGEVEAYEPQPPETELDVAALSDTVERVRMLCTKVKNTVTLSMRSTLAMQSMARIQHSENIERLQVAATDMMQQATSKALESIQRTVVQRASGAASEAMSKAAVVEDARSAQRFTCVTTAEMTLHAMIERNVQLDREMTTVLARRAKLRGIITACKFIQELCVRLINEVQ
jgi:hypothetical protein